jgi:hypothetical protein
MRDKVIIVVCKIENKIIYRTTCKNTLLTVEYLKKSIFKDVDYSNYLFICINDISSSHIIKIL